MKRISLLLFGLLGCAGAQLTAPGVNISIEPSAPTKYEVARKILVQPARLETRLPSGYTTGTLNFTLFSAVNTEVFLTFSDPRLVMRGNAADPVRLGAYTLQSIALVATGTHGGTITVSNSKGEVIAQVPYAILPAKTVNQSLSLNYSPTAQRGSVTYSISGAPDSVLDPRWNLNFNLNVSPDSGKVGGSVGVSLNW